MAQLYKLFVMIPLNICFVLNQLNKHFAMTQPYKLFATTLFYKLICHDSTLLYKHFVMTQF
jgi:hypothetical protein